MERKGERYDKDLTKRQEQIEKLKSEIYKKKRKRNNTRMGDNVEIHILCKCTDTHTHIYTYIYIYPAVDIFKYIYIERDI